MFNPVLAVSTTALVWGGLLLLLIVLAVVTQILKKHREDVWKSFARKYRCRFETTEEGPRIAGEYNRHPFTFYIPPDSSDTGPMAIEEVRLVMKFDDSQLPADLQIHSATGFVGELQRTLEDHRVPLEDEEFDHNLVVACEDPIAAKQCLSNQCRGELLKLVSEHPEVNLAIHSGEAIIQTRSAIDDRSQLESLLKSLSRVVDCLSSSPTH